MPEPSYTLSPYLPLLAETERTYVLTIHDLPEDEKPRERMRAQGAAALSTTELVAVLLSVGTAKEDVLSMAARITREYGERTFLHETDPERLAREIGLPIGKAMQIVAAGELGRRFFQKNAMAAPVLRTAKEVYAHIAGMGLLPREQLRGLYLNSHYKVVRDEVISIGTTDTSLIHPREVFRPALEYGAAAVILVHNHPSGVLAPSSADLAVTEQLIEAGRLLGIELVDHVIVTAEGYASVPAAYRS